MLDEAKFRVWWTYFKIFKTSSDNKKFIHSKEVIKFWKNKMANRGSNDYVAK